MFLVSRTGSKLLFFLLIKAVILALVIVFYQVGLAPDEAQYWTWSQALDWGYYSKPPAIAWQIWGTTTLLGNSELGVRFGALVLGFLIPLAVYYLAKCARLEERQAFWGAIAMAFSPLGVYLSLVSTTDAGAILFLVLAVAVLAKGPNYPLAGVMILFGALYKWVIFAFWPIALVFMLFNRSMRKWNVLWGIAISAVALLPSVYWNMTHEWATFKHVGGALGKSHHGNFFDFLGAQIGLLSPVFFVMLVGSYISLVKRGTRALYLCGAFPFAALIYFGAAFFTKMQPNWAAYLYPPGMVLVGWIAFPRFRAWLHVGTWLSIASVAAMLAIPALQEFLPVKVNPFRHSVGWNELTKVLERVGYHPKSDVLMGDKYQTASVLSFYSPGQKRAYFFNVSETRKNQFSYWSQLEKGESGYFVVLENTEEKALPWYEKHYVERLSPYFGEVSFVGAYPLYKGKYALLFRCERFSGKGPLDPNMY